MLVFGRALVVHRPRPYGSRRRSPLRVGQEYWIVDDDRRLRGWLWLYCPESASDSLGLRVARRTKAGVEQVRVIDETEQEVEA